MLLIARFELIVRTFLVAVHDVVVTLNFSRVRQLFLFLFFCLAGSRDESRLVLPRTPLHDIGGAFPRALFYCVLCTLTP
jgi:hypothetical protein